MPLLDKIIFRKRSVVECANDKLKNTAQIVHFRLRTTNFHHETRFNYYNTLLLKQQTTPLYRIQNGSN